jgi:hypothetical protein
MAVKIRVTSVMYAPSQDVLPLRFLATREKLKACGSICENAALINPAFRQARVFSKKSGSISRLNKGTVQQDVRNEPTAQEVEGPCTLAQRVGA